MTLVEICVDDLLGVDRARRGGADRVELCREVHCGGLTPSDEMVAAALEHAPEAGMQILVRPRPGDFINSEDEIATICADIARLHRLTESADVVVGFVVGVLDKDLRIHEGAAARMREAAGERPLTFHRGFDQVPDLPAGLDTLIRFGYDRVLTTGGHPKVAQCTVLADMVRQVGENLIVLASGGLRAHNVAEVIEASGVSEVHMRAPAPRSGSSETATHDSSESSTDQGIVEEIMHRVHTAGAPGA